jgi:hypothetical protein
MKIIIGPYTNWIGPYQIAEKILFWMDRDKDERVHKFGEWLAGSENDPSTLTKICRFIDSKKTRKEYIRIDKHDTWGMDHTLALIITPMLKQLRDTKHGAPSVDDEDVPDHIKSTSAPPKDNEWDIDGHHFLRWDWVLDEMIFSFESKLNDEWDKEFWTGEAGPVEWEETEKTFPNPLTNEEEKTYIMKKTGNLECNWTARQVKSDRIQNGFRLFGKYYQSLWD